MQLPSSDQTRDDHLQSDMAIPQPTQQETRMEADITTGDSDLPTSEPSTTSPIMIYQVMQRPLSKRQRKALSREDSDSSIPYSTTTQ